MDDTTMVNVIGQMRLDARFPRSYSIDTQVELPPSAPLPASTTALEWPSPPLEPAQPVWYYTAGGVSQEGGRDGLLLRIHPKDGEPWLGMFAKGDIGPSNANALCTTPDADRFLVVCSGAAYLAHAGNPGSGVKIGDYIHIALQIPEHGLLVLGTTDELTAYGAGPSHIWCSERLVIDELEVTAIRDGRVHVRGFDSIECALDVTTGKVVEGRAFGA